VKRRLKCLQVWVRAKRSFETERRSAMSRRSSLGSTERGITCFVKVNDFAILDLRNGGNGGIDMGAWRGYLMLIAFIVPCVQKVPRAQ